MLNTMTVSRGSVVDSDELGVGVMILMIDELVVEEEDVVMVVMEEVDEVEDDDEENVFEGESRMVVV